LFLDFDLPKLAVCIVINIDFKFTVTRFEFAKGIKNLLLLGYINYFVPDHYLFIFFRVDH